MKSTVIDRIFFPNLSWFLLLLIPVTFFGFYPSYFSQITSPTSSIVHVHGIMMVIWLAFAVIQPLLIKTNKSKTHRLVGKLSYFIMPLIAISGYFILRYSYHRALSGDDVGPPGFYPTDLPLEIKAAEFVVIGTVYWIWLLVYYVLGVTLRKNVVAHAIFMLAAALTILGPAGDILIGHICDAMGLPFNAFAGNFVFALVGLVFLGLLFLHQKKKLSLQPTSTVLLIHGIGVFLFYTLPYHPVWNWLAAYLFNG
jgi:hypothetical protein